MAETPRAAGNCPTCGSKYPREEVEVNVVMGAQLRAIVRSALIHVKNKLRAIDDPYVEGAAGNVIDEELTKWPLSVAGEPEDTLAQWLHHRYGPARSATDERDWNKLADEDKSYYEHEAAAVRRAVGRGGFKRVEPAVPQPVDREALIKAIAGPNQDWLTRHVAGLAADRVLAVLTSETERKHRQESPNG